MTMRNLGKLVVVVGLALLGSACLVQTSQGTFDCMGEPLTVAGAVTMTVHCSVVQTTGRP